MTKNSASFRGKSIDSTLNDLSVRNDIPKSAFVLLLLVYIIVAFLVSQAATKEGIVMLFGRAVPYAAFSGVFSSIANLCIMFLVLLFRKAGYYTSLVILFSYQFPILIMQFFFRGNVHGIAGLFSNAFTLVAITVIFIMNNKAVKYQRRIHYQAVTDRLTLLPNRFAATELMDLLIDDDEPFAIVSIDINNFKSINDTMGHEFGDKVMIEIANRWKDLADSKSTGTDDFVARLGGDEFSIIVRDYKNDEMLQKTIQTYKDEFEKKLTIDNCDYYMTANFGFAVFPNDGKTSDALLSGANAAMHEIRRAGRGPVLRYTTDMSDKGRSMEIERLIRNALDNDLIFCNLQPQYDIDHKLRGFEALARMKDENGQFISPAEFIPVADETGLVDRIDARVFSLAAKFLHEVREKKGSDITISTNVSVRHLMKNNFIDETKGILETYDIPADRVEIEITESIMIDSTEKALSCINELKAMGIKIAIDDFGTGYSSLSYLNNLPSDMLKIDKSFIDVMNDSESSKKYVATIISIGHILNLEVISEGVESESQIETLRSVGCDYIQGYVWGRPLSVDDAMTLVMSI